MLVYMFANTVMKYLRIVCTYYVRIPNEEAQLKEARWLFIITETSGLFKAH